MEKSELAYFSTPERGISCYDKQECFAFLLLDLEREIQETGSRGGREVKDKRQKRRHTGVSTEATVPFSLDPGGRSSDPMDAKRPWRCLAWRYMDFYGAEPARQNAPGGRDRWNLADI